MSAPSDDPEHARIRELVDAERQGRATPGEREELAMYESEEELAAVVRQARSRPVFAGEQLERVRQDQAMAVATDARTQRLRRGGIWISAAGVAMLALTGFGVVVLATGIGLLIASFVQDAKRDPYREVKR